MICQNRNDVTGILSTISRYIAEASNQIRQHYPMILLKRFKKDSAEKISLSHYNGATFLRAVLIILR